MRYAWPVLAALGAALALPTQAWAECVSWRAGPELSIRSASGWTTLQLRQEGDFLTGTARRQDGGNAPVTGRLQPRRLWLKVGWPEGGTILEGTIGANGVVTGTDATQAGSAWEAMEPLQCVASSSGSGGSAVGEPGLDEFTRAARAIIGIIRGDQPQPATPPAQSSTGSPPTPGSGDPFGSSAPASQSGGTDPFGSSAPASQSGGTDPFGAPSTGSAESGQASTGAGPADTPPPAPASPGSSRAVPPAAYQERPIGSARSTPIILIPMGPLSDNCAAGFVWREARSSDHVCVPPAARDRVREENRVARQFRDNQTISLCIAGYVWREAFPGDQACVTPAARGLAAEENRLGGSRKAKN